MRAKNADMQNIKTGNRMSGIFADRFIFACAKAVKNESAKRSVLVLSNCFLTKQVTRLPTPAITCHWTSGLSEWKTAYGVLRNFWSSLCWLKDPTRECDKLYLRCCQRHAILIIISIIAVSASEIGRVIDAFQAF